MKINEYLVIDRKVSKSGQVTTTETRVRDYHRPPNAPGRSITFLGAKRRYDSEVTAGHFFRPDWFCYI